MAPRLGMSVVKGYELIVARARVSALSSVYICIYLSIYKYKYIGVPPPRPRRWGPSRVNPGLRVKG